MLLDERLDRIGGDVHLPGREQRRHKAEGEPGEAPDPEQPTAVRPGDDVVKQHQVLPLAHLVLVGKRPNPSLQRQYKLSTRVLAMGRTREC